MRVITLTRIADDSFRLTVDVDGICVVDRADGPGPIAGEIAKLGVDRYDRLFGGPVRVRLGDLATMLGVPRADLG